MCMEIKRMDGWMVEFFSKQLQSSCSASWDHVAVLEFTWECCETLSRTSQTFAPG